MAAPNAAYGSTNDLHLPFEGSSRPWSEYPPPSLGGSLHHTPSSHNSMTQAYEEQVPLKHESSTAFPPPAAAFDREGDPTHKASRKKWIILGIVAAIIIIVLAVVLPIYFTIIKPNSENSDSSGKSGGSKDGDATSSSARPSQSAEPEVPQVLTRGGDGSEVTMENGEKFIYRNSLGGFWVHDPSDPFNLDARPNDFTPPLNTTWRWGRDRVYGVNLGGLFVIEPFITPHLFQKYQGAVDEYTLTQAMRQAGTLNELEEHYNTFITEQDIAEIAGAGLNWLRIPIGFWAIETYDNEPFIERTSWTYILRTIEWARKYGLRVYLDLHAVPGSQNGLNHSARLRAKQFLQGNMGLANAQRTLYYLRIFTQFISQPEYKNVVTMIGLVNEPESRDIGMPVMRSFYLEAYNMIREITGFGEGNGPYIAVGDGFRNALEWARDGLGLMPGADRFVMDIHPYVAFDEGFRSDLLTVRAADGELGGVWPTVACERWGTYFNNSRQTLGVTVGGEFSAAINDCGLFMRAVNVDSGHPQCPLYNNWENWSDDLKGGLLNFVLASFDAIGDFFFWTWKIGPSQAGRVETPMWSYQLGLEHGWIPRDPRVALGKCAALGAPQAPFSGSFAAHQTGALPNPTIPAAYSAANPWPPASFSSAEVPVSLMPTYTATGSVVTLPVPTFTGAPASATEGVDGWTNDGDSEGGVVPIAACVYPDQYEGVFAAVPTAPCS